MVHLPKLARGDKAAVVSWATDLILALERGFRDVQRSRGEDGTDAVVAGVGEVRPEDQLGWNATPGADVTNAVQTAWTLAETHGYALRLTDGKAYGVTGIAGKPITVVGTGILYPVGAPSGGKALVHVRQPPLFVKTITAITATTADLGNGGATRVHNVTLADATGIAVGQVGRVISRDISLGTTVRRKAETVYVVKVTGSVVTLAGRLRDTYTDTPQLVIYDRSRRMVWNGPSIQCDRAAAVANGWQFRLFYGAGLYGASIKPSKLGVAPWAAIMLEGCTHCHVDGPVYERGINLAVTDPDGTWLGYGGLEAGGQGNRWTNQFGFDLRHVWDTWAGETDLDDVWTYGGCRDIEVDGGVAGWCSGAAWGTHYDAFNVTFSNIITICGYGGESGSSIGIQFRGHRQKAIDCRVYGAETGYLCLRNNSDEITRHEFVGCHYEGDGQWFDVPSDEPLVKVRVIRPTGRVASDKAFELYDGAEIEIIDPEITIAHSAAAALVRLNGTGCKVTIRGGKTDIRENAASFRLVSYGGSGHVIRTDHEIEADEVTSWADGCRSTDFSAGDVTLVQTIRSNTAPTSNALGYYNLGGGSTVESHVLGIGLSSQIDRTREVMFQALPVHADQAAAASGGLVAGELFRDGDGYVLVKT